MLFQRRYLKEQPGEDQEEVEEEEKKEGENEIDEKDDEEESSDTNDKTEDQDKSPEESDDINVLMKNRDTDSPEPVDKLTNGAPDSETKEGNETAVAEEAAGIKVVVNGVDHSTTNGVEGNPEVNGTRESESPNGVTAEPAEASADGGKEDAADGAAEAAPDEAAPAESEYDPFADDEDDHDQPATEPSEGGSEAEIDNTRIRYEISHWHYHFQEAEKLWPRSEREGNAEWDRLWNMAEQFLCKSPAAFKSWQRQYSSLPNSVFFVYRETLSPLHVAAAFGLTGLVEVLMKRGEPANTALKDGRQPLWFAAGKDIELLKLLLENGADPNSRNDFPPPFHRQLTINPQFEDVKLFFDHGADCSFLDSWDLNAMHWFSFSGEDVAVFNLLLEHGGDVNVVDDVGETPLHKLLSRRDVPLELLRAYIEKGAGVNVDDHDSQSVLPLVLKYNMEKLTIYRTSV
jgi:hypothetical protein